MMRLIERFPELEQALWRVARKALRHYPPIRGKGWISGKLSPDTLPEGKVITARNGIKVAIHPDGIYSGLYLFGEYEPVQSALYMNIVRSGDVVLDVGANFGWYSSLLGRAVGSSGKVYAFEPIEWIADLAENTVALNGLGSRVRLIRTGLGSTEGQFTVYTLPGATHGHASASNFGRADAKPHTCRITTLDSYIKATNPGTVAFMKLDIEGHEREVFRGAREFLGAHDAPIIGFEINAECLRDRQLSASAVAEPLREAGYVAFWSIGRRTALRASELEEGKNCDYLAAKERDIARVEEAIRRL